MWLHDFAVGGMLFSPMLVFVLVAALCTLLTYQCLRILGWHAWIWKDAWFYLSVFICFVAAGVRLMG